MEADMLVNVVLVLVPTDLIAPKQTIRIIAIMTEYSTAVGPSWDRMNLRILRVNRDTAISPSRLIQELV
jgi:hypothetical protein